MYKILFLSMGAFALGVDAYIMAGLLPGIASSFAVSGSGAGQTVSMFTVSYAVSAPIFGALTAGKPVRLTLAAALTVFTLANACSALADSFLGRCRCYGSSPFFYGTSTCSESSL